MLKANHGNKYTYIHIEIYKFKNLQKPLCKLCLMEKLYILNAPGDKSCLNNKSEFISKCRHQIKYFLGI